ncbi:MAG: hypothetical protein OXJ90_05035 [Spirochaetaceae bacterium]|nr:hypothetical protein [Spirochaetaceae bacterium]
MATSPSTLRLSSRPSNRDHPPRPHSAADEPPSAAAAVTENALPASNSPPLIVCGCSGVPAGHPASA